MPDPLKPIGFWSYTNSDDSVSGGLLSQLRQVIADELQMKMGHPDTHPVRIFQDRAVIPYGSDWREQIDLGIDAASFFIAIVTPAFLQSRECAYEILRFRQREAEQDRKDLIFPLVYEDIDDIRPEECHDPEVLALVKSRQVFNFRHLRHADPRVGEARMRLEGWVRTIRSALRRDMTPASQVAVEASMVPPRPMIVPVPPSISPSPRSKPHWASDAGTDGFGEWAEISVRSGLLRPVVQRLRLIPAGQFLMGSPNGVGFDWEHPQIRVTFKEAFWLFDTPVTQALWQAVMGNNPSHFKGPNRPVECVSWDDARKFAAALNRKIPGLELGLPSESQWEYACRAGTTGDRYHEDVDAIAWYGGNSGGRTHDVKGKLPNRWGLYDMLGNVEEWCEDVYARTHNGASPDGAPRAAHSSDASGDAARVMRGGYWIHAAADVRSAYRYGFHPSNRLYFIGFRPARVPARSAPAGRACGHRRPAGAEPRRSTRVQGRSPWSRNFLLSSHPSFARSAPLRVLPRSSTSIGAAFFRNHG